MEMQKYMTCQLHVGQHHVLYVAWWQSVDISLGVLNEESLQMEKSCMRHREILKKLIYYAHVGQLLLMEP